MRLPIRAVCAAALLFLAGRAAPAVAQDPATPRGRIVVLTEAGAPGAAEVERELLAAGGDRATVKILRLEGGDAPDPMQKGRLLAAIQAADLVIPVADRATAFILNEREDIPVYFIGAASMIPGRSLAVPGVSGILPYNAAETIEMVRALGLAPLGLAYTAGYAAIAAQIESEAGARGVKVVRRSIDLRSELAPAVRELTREARIVWVLGDPLLTRGAGFSFLIEQSLASRVPIVAPARWEAERGALVGCEPAWPALAEAAGAGLRLRLAGASTLTVVSDPAARFTLAPPGGTFLVNRTLADRWNLALPSGTAWKGIR